MAQRLLSKEEWNSKKEREEPKRTERSGYKQLNQHQASRTYRKPQNREEKKGNEKKIEIQYKQKWLDGLMDTFEPGARCGTSIKTEERQMTTATQQNQRERTQDENQNNQMNQRKPRVGKIGRKGKVESKMKMNTKTKSTPLLLTHQHSRLSLHCIDQQRHRPSNHEIF